MKKVLQIILIFFLSVVTYGQSNKKLNIPIYINGDTISGFKWQLEKVDILKIPNLISSTDNFHFRFWTDGQVVDIWTQDFKTFFGTLTNYTYSYEPYDLKKQKRNPSTTFSNQVQLDTSIAKQSYLFIKSINSIPTQDSIKNWGSGLDGITYLFETSTPTYYSFKSYWTPTAKSTNLIEAKQIQEFVDQMYTLLNLNAEYDKFFATLKTGSYTSDHFGIKNKLNEKQIDNLKKYKPYKEYLDSVRDTLNNYLSDTLSKIFQKYGDLECYDQFFLKFSKKNKLIRIMTNRNFHNFEDRMDCYKCRRKIRQAFRLVQVDFVHSKVSYWKELHYLNNKIIIED